MAVSVKPRSKWRDRGDYHQLNKMDLTQLLGEPMLHVVVGWYRHSAQCLWASVWSALCIQAASCALNLAQVTQMS